MMKTHKKAQSLVLLLLMAQSVGMPWLHTEAQAAYAPRVVVPPITVAEQAPERQATRLWNQLNDELKGRTGQMEWLALPVARPAPRTVAGPPAEAQVALNQGKVALEELKFAEASKHLKKALEALLADPARTDFEMAKDAYLASAVAYFRMGEERRAEIAMASLLRLDPAFELGSSYPPIFIREFEKTRERQKRAAPGELRLEGPEGATAWVNGRMLGPVPVTEQGLFPGAHYVKLENAMGEVFSRAVDIRPGPNRVKGNFQSQSGKGRPLPAPLVYDVLSSDTVNQAAQYAKAAGADFVLLGVLYASQEGFSLAMALYSARRQGFVALTPREFPKDWGNTQAQLYNLAEELAPLLTGSFQPVELPYRVSPVLAPRVAPVETPSKVQPASASRKVLVPGDAVKTPLPTDSERVVLTPVTPREPSVTSELDYSVAPVSPPRANSGVSPWVWVVVGVGVAAAATGAYYGYTALQQPVTGTLTAQW